MVVSFLLLSAAQGAVPEVYWDPGLPDLGQQGLLSGEFDGHAGLDLVATYSNGDTQGLAVQLSGAGGETWVLNPTSPEATLRLREGQWDEDAELEILVGLPDHLVENHPMGAAWVLDLSGKTVQPDTLEDWIVLSVNGDSSTGGFGTDLQLIDCNGTEGVEFLVSSPGDRGSQVRAFGRDPDGQTQTLASWSLKGAAAFGVALEPFEQDGDPRLAIGACASPLENEQACDSGGALYVVSVHNCNEAVSLESDSALFSDLEGAPRGLHALLPEASTFSVPLLWSAPEKQQLLELSGTGGALSVETQADLGEWAQSLTTEAPQTWMVSSGQVWQIEGSLGEGDAETVAHRSHSVSNVVLGGSLSNAGDLDGDGCEDVLSTASDNAVYWLSGCEEEKPDTGDTGEDTGDTSEDTGDTDTGTAPCEESFGWTCSSAIPNRSLNLSFLLMTVVFWASRRRETE